MKSAVDLKPKPAVKDKQPFATVELEQIGREYAALPTARGNSAEPPEFAVDDAVSELPDIASRDDEHRRQIFLARQIFEWDQPCRHGRRRAGTAGRFVQGWPANALPDCRAWSIPVRPLSLSQDRRHKYEMQFPY